VKNILEAKSSFFEDSLSILIKSSYFCKNFIVAQHSLFSAMLQLKPELLKGLCAAAIKMRVQVHLVEKQFFPKIYNFRVAAL
jgi:hypothetical protein